MDTPPPASVTAEESLVYRPLSLMAISSVIVAGLFTALLLGTLLVGLINGSPIYPLPWLLGIPVLGAALALAAGWRIRSSEGTLAGKSFANWGWWLSVITGLGFAAFYGATVMAVFQQADNYMRVEGPDSGFFPLLQQGKVDQAFLLTVSPARRANVNPNDMRAMQLLDIPISKSAKGLLSMFRANDMVLMLSEAGEQAQVKALGVKDWVYSNKGFTVRRKYHISTPEADLDVEIPVVSSEGDESGPGRKWFVQFFPPPVKSNMQLTPLGELMSAYRNIARFFIKGWVDKINLNEPNARGMAYLETVEPAERDKFRKLGAIRTGMRLVMQTLDQFGQAPGAGLPMSSLGPLYRWEDYDPWLYLPGYADFITGKGLNLTDWEKVSGVPDVRSKLRAQVEDSFFGRNYSGRPQISLKASEEAYLPYKKKNGKIQILASYDMPVGMTAQDPSPKFIAEIVVTAEANEVANVEVFATAAAPEWRIVSINVRQLFNLPQGPMKIDPSSMQPGPLNPPH
jgi:hypothetical protein